MIINLRGFVKNKVNTLASTRQTLTTSFFRACVFNFKMNTVSISEIFTGCDPYPLTDNLVMNLHMCSGFLLKDNMAPRFHAFAPPRAEVHKLVRVSCVKDFLRAHDFLKFHRRLTIFDVWRVCKVVQHKRKFYTGLLFRKTAAQE